MLKSRLRVCIEEASSFLRELWWWDRLEGWERFYLRGPDGEWSLRRGEDLGAVMAEVQSIIGDWSYSPHAYLPRGGRTEENIVQLNAIIIDLDGGDLDETISTLGERGLKPHYVIHTSPGRYQLVLRERPIRLGKHNREAVLKRQSDMTNKLYQLIGGDMAAAKVNQLFRLPGSRRQLEDGVWTVSIIERNDHLAYPLERLERAVAGTGRRSRSTFRGYRPAEDQEQRGNNHRVLRSPALRWLQTHRIVEGSRNTALVAMAYAAAMDGLNYDQARPMLLRWVEEHTEGPYPRLEAERVIRSCYANPKGLDPKILMTIQDINDEAMTEEQARSVLKFMPKTRQIHQRLPLEELRNRPLFESLMKVLNVIAELQLKHNRRSVLITDETLAALADVPLGTLYRLRPLLRGLQVKRTIRIGRSLHTLYDLTKLLPLNKHYTFIVSNLAIQGLFRRPFRKVLSYWAWRFRDAWTSFLKRLKMIWWAFAGAARPAQEGVVGAVVAPIRQVSRPRGPPRRGSGGWRWPVRWTSDGELCSMTPVKPAG